jgi:hypothetical protein
LLRPEGKDVVDLPTVETHEVVGINLREGARLVEEGDYIAMVATVEDLLFHLDVAILLLEALLKGEERRL